ncbi:solute carrier family 25 (mitochondrial phosphate transporter), member 23/24/25/41 [Kwoniella mangroviensis CBS 10435]|uniref:Solute carrier family 25 (Mitochondrial phosphate transporter), member 23/24/25/41 n=1 Tax=Kwoniella mangroviensis CBS 10435 TaxID=1331196 RepID=A0A1B9IQQ5_9TREE|nr:solute carrier family 25 (mitochondrial phosphate transporter), member 23/24/25/41 [Kwoniella mangroviensis CBS 10435]OCF75026.1 solute carrier family 25 (mitochondrial phosphate transporter), member 23/24/25/41 [Kwoniella mangroviensis CBS 8886]
MPSFRLHPHPSTSSTSDQHSHHHRQHTSTDADIAVGAGTSTLEIAEEELDHDQGSESVSVRTRWKDIMSDNSAVINTFIAGGLAGAASRTVVSPLERLKIILQVQASSASHGSSGQAYSGVWESLTRMWKNEGWRGFMKGNGINVVRILPYSALQFTSYGAFKSVLATWSGEEVLSTPLRLTAGAGAGIVAVAATYPLDLVRARLSVATSGMAIKSTSGGFTAEDAKLGMVGMTKKVYRTEGGIRGLYRGCWATAVGVAPYVSLNFYIYESLKSMILPSSLSPTTSEPELILRKLSCGALAGATSLIFTHPFDVLRRKLQVAGLASMSPQHNGAVDVIKWIVRTEGFWKGMYRGLVPNLIKVTPSIAVSFYTFETVRDLLAALGEE